MTGFPLIDRGKVRVRQCRRGVVLFNPQDAFVGRSFDLYGEFSEGEVSLFRQYVKENDFVLDVGANIGAHTLALSHIVGRTGHVWAFEPQAIVYQQLVANLALNSITNVTAEHAGLARSDTLMAVPRLDHDRLNNYGGIRLEPLVEGQPSEAVFVKRLDSYANFDVLHFAKIDVEGMEYDVLQGAAETIMRCKPVLYVENDKRDKSPALINLIEKLGYKMWWHIPPLFNPMNYAQLKQNVFPNIVSCNMLCLPEGAQLKAVDFLHPVKSAEEWILQA